MGKRNIERLLAKAKADEASSNAKTDRILNEMREVTSKAAKTIRDHQAKDI